MTESCLIYRIRYLIISLCTFRRPELLVGAATECWMRSSVRVCCRLRECVETHAARRPPHPVWMCVGAECERPEQFTTSPRAVLRELQPSDPRGGSALHKAPLFSVLHLHCCPSVFSLSVPQTRSDAHTPKTSLYAVGEKGVTEW